MYTLYSKTVPDLIRAQHAMFRLILPLVLASFWLLLSTTYVYAETIYVKHDATGADDGTSWANAYRSLQDALTSAVSGDEIWVASGVYYPDEGEYESDNDRSASFYMVEGVSIYGGFGGGEGTVAERDVATNVTVLSGDIDGNDTIDASGIVTRVENISGENAYHVTSARGLTVGRLDGFTVTGGQADGTVGTPCETGCGGGMYNSGSSPTVANVTYMGNVAEMGGGMYNYSSSPVITDTTFGGNTAEYGGGMYNYLSNPNLSDVTFTANLAPSGDGGGMYNYASSPRLVDVLFEKNKANVSRGLGGGMYNNSSNPTLSGVGFDSNWAKNGGGIYNINSGPALTNGLIRGNVADYGGGLYNYFSNPSLANVVLSGNVADEYGGGLYNNTSHPSLTNSTVGGNRSGSGGGGLYNTNGSSPVLRNSILWDNISSSITNVGSGSRPDIGNSLVQGSGGSGAGWNSGVGIDSGGNVDADPRFLTMVDPSAAPTEGGNLGLYPTSPAVDAGDNVAVPGGLSTDLAGNPRIVATKSITAVVDMGAYETLYQCPGTVPARLYVKKDAGGGANGTTWVDAYPNMQDALTLSEACSGVTEIWVASGVYYPDEGEYESNNDRSASFHMVEGVSIYGGFGGGEGTVAERDVATNVTVLSGDIDGNDTIDASGIVTRVENISGENAYHVTSARGLTVGRLDGFTVTGGQADGTVGTPCETGCGGGMYNSGSSPTVANVTYVGNVAEMGGGMYNYSSSSTVANVTYVGNVAEMGGGMYNYSSSPRDRPTPHLAATPRNMVVGCTTI